MTSNSQPLQSRWSIWKRRRLLVQASMGILLAVLFAKAERVDSFCMHPLVWSLKVWSQKVSWQVIAPPEQACRGGKRHWEHLRGMNGKRQHQQPLDDTKCAGMSTTSTADDHGAVRTKGSLLERGDKPQTGAQGSSPLCRNDTAQASHSQNETSPGAHRHTTPPQTGICSQQAFSLQLC